MEQQRRKPNRLKDYDYSQNGAYFITICIDDRKPILSRIAVGATCGRLSETGTVVENEIQKLNTVYENVFVDNYVIMLTMYTRLSVLIKIIGDRRSPLRSAA